MTTAKDFAAYTRGEYDNSTIIGAKGYDHRLQKLRKRYNLNHEDFEARKQEQGGKCPICRTREAVVVDHCHEKSHVRGILCKQCNGALGMMRDDPIVLLRAVEYLLLNAAVEG